MVVVVTGLPVCCCDVWWSGYSIPLLFLQAGGSEGDWTTLVKRGVGVRRALTTPGCERSAVSAGQSCGTFASPAATASACRTGTDTTTSPAPSPSHDAPSRLRSHLERNTPFPASSPRDVSRRSAGVVGETHGTARTSPHRSTPRNTHTPPAPQRSEQPPYAARCPWSNDTPTH